MKTVLGILALSLGITIANALQISEIMSNPIGDDSGREWLEVYNNGSSPVDLSTLTISIKGGKPIPVTSVSGGTMLPQGAYAVVGSISGGETKFLQDFASFSGVLLKSSITLVNTGTASIELFLDGATADSLISYTPAKEGKTLARIGGSFQTGNPTPGAPNEVAPVEVKTTTTKSSLSNQGGNQTVTQADQSELASQGSAPSADIVIFLPTEKIVIAGAETEFTVKSSTHTGKVIPNVTYSWTFGDGGQGTGSSTKYTYAYTGRYVAEVEASNGEVTGTGRTMVKVVSPNITISAIGKDNHGYYFDIDNPNAYELNLSQWRLTFDGVAFPFPKNTILLASSTTRFSGQAMGFGSLTISSSTVIKILFPHLEEVTRYSLQEKGLQKEATTTPLVVFKKTEAVFSGVKKLYAKPRTNIASSSQSTSTTTKEKKVRATSTRDTKIVSLIRALFNK